MRLPFTGKITRENVFHFPGVIRNPEWVTYISRLAIWQSAGGQSGHHRYKNPRTFFICNTSQNSTSQKSLTKNFWSLEARTFLFALKAPSSVKKFL
jgi:hypothetical protein